MTRLQKEFEDWLKSFEQIALSFKGECLEKEEFFRYKFTTKFGTITACVSRLDYDEQKKHGFVSIYLKFGMDADPKTIEPHVWGDFNHYSGKWNIHITGNGAALPQARITAFDELRKRLNHVEAGKTLP